MPISTYLKTNLDIINHVDLEQQSVILNRDSGLLNATKKVSRLINFIRWCISRITCRHFPQNPQLDEASRLIIDEIGKVIQTKTEITSEEKTALSDSLKKLHIISKKNGGKTSKLEAMLVKVEAIVPVQILVPKIPINENKNQNEPKPQEEPVKTKAPVAEPTEDQKNDNIQPDAKLKKPLEVDQKDVINQAQGKKEEKGPIQLPQDQQIDPKKADNEIDDKNKEGSGLPVKIEFPVNDKMDADLKNSIQKEDSAKAQEPEIKIPEINPPLIQNVKNEEKKPEAKKVEKFQWADVPYPPTDHSRDAVLMNLKNHRHMNEAIFNKFKDDKEIVKEACERISPQLITCASEDLQKDEEFIKELLKVCGEALEYLPQFMDKQEFRMIAVKEDPQVLENLTLKKDKETKELILVGVRNRGHLYYHSNLRNFMDDRDIALLALEDVNACEDVYKYLPAKFTGSDCFIVEAALRNEEILDFFEEEFKGSKPVRIDRVRKLYEEAESELQKNDEVNVKLMVRELYNKAKKERLEKSKINEKIIEEKKEGVLN